MKSILRRLMLATAILSLLALPTLAGEAHIEEVRKVKLKILAGDELIDLDLSDLEVGESQQTYAEDGSLIVATRNDDSYTIQVGDEEEITVPVNIGHGHGEVEIESGDGHQVIVRKHVSKTSGDGNQAVFISGDGDVQHIEIDEDSHFWVSGDDSESAHQAMAHVIHLERQDPAQHLIDSGVLDDLDEDTRQRILDKLREIEPAHGDHASSSASKIVIRKHRSDKEDEQ